MSEAENNAIVIDNGSGMVKAGYAGDDAPCSVFPSVIGKTRFQAAMAQVNEQKIYVGHAAVSKKGMLTLEYPIAHGIVGNWEHMKILWDHTYSKELRVDSSEHRVLLTEAPINPKSNKETMVRTQFEDFNVKGTYVAIQAMLSLYSSGRTTGVVLDSGDGVSHTVPIYEGYALPHAIRRLDLAGRELTTWMQQLLKERGHSFQTTAEKEIVKDIKEKNCFISLDYEEDLKAFEDPEKFKTYELPDGQIINIGDEQFRCPEALFTPSLIGIESLGVDHYVVDTINATEIDIRRELFSNIVLSGGTTLFQNMGERMKTEMSNRMKNSKIKVIASPDRGFSVWIGGSILSSLSSFDVMWITREEYDEVGAAIVHRKCF